MARTRSGRLEAEAVPEPAPEAPEVAPEAPEAEGDDVVEVDDRWPFLAATSPVPTFVGLLVAGAGFVLLLLAWGQVAGETAVALQLPYVVSAGLIGLALVMVGLVTVTVQSKRRDAATLERQVDELAAVFEHLARALPPGDGRR